MRRLRSHAKAASPSAPDQSTAPQSPPAMETGGLSGTPAPSPSTSVSRGLGSAAADGGSLKSPDVGTGTGTPRRSLRLAGAASPNTHTAGSSVLDGASSGAGSRSGGKRRGRPRVSALSAASPKEVESGGDGGGGGEVRALGGGGGCSLQGSLQSGPRPAKRLMEPYVDGIGSDGGAGSGDNKVYDEMLHQDAEAGAKRHKSTLVRGADYVPDSESESDKDSVLPAKEGTSVSAGVADYVPDSESDKEDCVLMGDGGTKVPVRLSTSPNLIDLNVVPMGSDMTYEWRRDGSVRADEGEIGEANNRNGQLLSEESMHMHDPAEAAAGGIVKPSLPSPVAVPATAEAYADMNSSEDLLRHESGDKGKGKEKLVLGNNDSGATASVGVRAGARTRKFSRDDKGKGKMVAEEGLLPQRLGNDVMDVEPVASEENQSIPGAADAPVEPLRRQAAREIAIKLAPKFAFFKPDEDVQSEEDDAEELEPPAGPQDWPGPFSTAMRIMDDRDAKLRARELNPSKLDSIADKVIAWTPSKDKKTPMRPVPSLTSLCLRTLANNAEGIESLGGISEELKNKLLMELCHSRKMNTHLLTELLCDNPVTLQLSECSWLSEDDFGNIFGKCMTESLEKIEHLEVLSMSGIQSVCDKFVNELIPIHGSNLRELAFAGCLDEAVSKYLEESGGCLTELSLNNVEKVGNLTAQAIALKCSLEVLDLSFCRGLTDEALGLIVDSCSSLRILKLFGCTQVTDVFLKGHSNSLVKIIGIEGSILDRMDRS
ncbi:hypothetical protein ACQ4PT_066240 [Festuca glaucescens]